MKFVYAGCILLAGYFLWARIHTKSIHRQFTAKAEPEISYTYQQLDSLRSVAMHGGYNADLAVLINLGKFSGNERFFLVDLKTHKTLLSGLCCHGGGYGNDNEEVVFSNVSGSHCSSDGIYKIGYPYTGTFGKSYKLYGLSTTNSNAFDRFIVLHSHDCVPETAVNNSICESQGCPTLAPSVFSKLSTYLDASNKPVLMWIYSMKNSKSNSFN